MSSHQRKQSIENALEPGPGPDPKNPIAFWAEHGHWPEEQDSPISHLLARKKSSFYDEKKSSSYDDMSRKRPSSTITATTPSDQRPREEKSAPYEDPRYETLLELNGSYMVEDPVGLASASRDLCRSLLENSQPIPSDTLFRDDIFKTTIQNLRQKNEARVIQDITRLIVPSAENLFIFGGAKHLDVLTESVNEGWNNSIPLTDPRPQPDYSVGFRRTAFTKDQFDKLSPFIGDFLGGDQSFFMATYYIYFPFLTCEVKCGATALDTADRQNAHSMTLAVRGIVELFRCVKRENEANRQILAFSISHSNEDVRIYGHYPVINGKDTKYYRYLIKRIDLIDPDGKDKWVAYRFTRNVYDIWMPAHFKNICSAVDQLPSDLDFGVPPLSGASGLSQDESVEQNSRSSNAGVTPDTSFTRPEARPEAAKRRKGQA